MKINFYKLLILPILLCNLISCAPSNQESNNIKIDNNTKLNYYLYNQLYKFYDYEIKEVYHIKENCEVAKIYSPNARDYSVEIINGIKFYRGLNYVFVVNNNNNAIYSLTDAYTNLIISNEELIKFNQVINYNEFYDEDKFKNAVPISNIVLEEKSYDIRYYPLSQEFYTIYVYIDINFSKHIFTEKEFNYEGLDWIDFNTAWAHEYFIDGTYKNYSSMFLTNPKYVLYFKDLESRRKAIDYIIDNKPYYIKMINDPSMS